MTLRGQRRKVSERTYVPQAPSDTVTVVSGLDHQDDSGEAQDAEPSSRQPGHEPGALPAVTRP